MMVAWPMEMDERPGHCRELKQAQHAPQPSRQHGGLERARETQKTDAVLLDCRELGSQRRYFTGPWVSPRTDVSWTGVHYYRLRCVPSSAALTFYPTKA